MTSHALRVVTERIVFDRLVRVVAGGAGDAAVVGIVTGAIGDAVGLKANVADAAQTFQRNLLPTAMARAAELLRQIVGA